MNHPMNSILANFDPIMWNQLQGAIVNLQSLSRSESFNRNPDERRDLNKECGYPDGMLTTDFLNELDRRDPLANRINRVWSSETWAESLQVYEDESIEDLTEFEAAWYDLANMLRGEPSYASEEDSHPVIDEMARLDDVCGIGSYGIMVIGFDDGRDLSQPVEGMNEDGSFPATRGDDGMLTPVGNTRWQGGDKYRLTCNAVKGRRVVYLQTLPESMCPISTWETNKNSFRCGLPVLYMVTLNDSTKNRQGNAAPAGTMQVHWSRVLHVADNTMSSRVFGAPRVEPVINRVLDCQKIYGASGEGYYQGGFPGLSLETHPQLGGDVNINRTATRQELERYLNGMQRYLVNSGMTAKTLTASVLDPTAFIGCQIEAICIQLDIAMRIFLGSERGELSSGQDDRRSKKKTRSRRVRFANPRIVYPLLNRLINVGALPVPPMGYKVWWPDAEVQTALEKSDVAVKEAQAISLWISCGGDAAIAPIDFWSRIMGKTEKEAKEITENASQFQEETDGLLPPAPVIVAPGSPAETKAKLDGVLPTKE